MIHKYSFPSDWADLRKDFQKIFGIPFNDFYDGFMSWVSGHISIDIARFDEYLHDRFGQYENQGLSMQDIILMNYGRKAVDLVEGLI